MPNNTASASTQARLIARLGLSPQEAEALSVCLTQGQSARKACVLTPLAPEGYVPSCVQPPSQADPPWLGKKVMIARPEVSLDEGNAKGFYYSLDLSSVWETAPLAMLSSRPRRCLDMCAAPGGKSILAQTRVAPQLHVASEVHHERLGILRHNLARCGFSNLYTQNWYPAQWSTHAPGAFDLVLVDAPCSGQSLLAKGLSNPGCFHPSIIKGNAKRQRGILVHALTVLAPGGYLLYTTCTYAPEENEKTMAWVLKRYPQIEAVAVPTCEPFQVPSVAFPCYRLLPTQGWGAGGFSCLLRNRDHPLEHMPELPEDVLAWPIQSS